MQSSLYVALSAQLSLQRRLDTIANNVANASTAGFRAEEVKFETILSRTSADPVAFSTAGETYLSRSPGEFVKTDNPLDVAVQGDAWISVASPNGTIYTRDGRFRITQTGELQTLNGYQVLDAGGTPLRLDPAAGPPAISRDGTITQNNAQVGAIGLFNIPREAKLTRYDNSGVIPDRPATPALDFTQLGVVQGFSERANVNPVLEISRLISVSRAFEAITASLNDSQSTLQTAIQDLGPAS